MEYSTDDLTNLVREVFTVDDITLGTTDGPFLVRYRGVLTLDSLAAYDKLENDLKPGAVTPLFRIENKQQVIYLIKSLPEPKPFRWSINLIMFILTLLSVLAVGIMYVSPSGFPTSMSEFWTDLLKGGLPFGLSMMIILGTHEFGHFIAGRRHGIHVSLPYFIPMPFSLLGTMGAFINMKDAPKNRRDLLDVGIAGPLTGFIVSTIVLFIGLKLSRLDVIPTSFPAGMGTQMEGNSILYLLLKFIAFGKWLPAPAKFTLPPLLYWVRFFFTGMPKPLGATDVMLSPVAWAGWAGMLVTSLNLIPAGQLDGGHLFYTLFGKDTSRKLIPVILVALVLLGFVWSGWWLWAVIVFLLGRAYAEPRDQITELDPKRKALAIIGFVIFLLTFTPIPLMIVS